ncbi:MAG: hypothetical protein JWM80_2556 [Cyanobacteria bacterium RYN_339]|nr:hypothetical protein [Cyanobacteria bacterium RYN_339]
MGDWPPQRYALLSFALFGPIGLSVGYLPTGRLDRAILTPFGVWAVTLGSAYVGANIASLPYRFRDKDAFYWTPKEVEYQGMWIGGGIGLAASCGYVLMDQALPPPWAPWLTPALSLITVTCIYSALTSNQ